MGEISNALSDYVVYRVLTVITGKQGGDTINNILHKYRKKYHPEPWELSQVGALVRYMEGWGWLALNPKLKKEIRYTKRPIDEILRRVGRPVYKKKRLGKKCNKCDNFSCRHNKKGYCSLYPAYCGFARW